MHAITNHVRFAHATRIRAIIAATAALALLSPLVACGSTSAEASGAPNNPDAQTIVIGENTRTNKPYNYLNEDGEIDGYEHAVLKAVDDKLPQYKFDYKPLDWTNLLVSLDTGKVDLAASDFGINDERKQKYAYTQEPHLVNNIRVVVSSKNTSINSIDDLGGKTVQAWQGEQITHVLEDWSTKHPDNPMNLKFGDWTWEQYVASIDKGATDAGALDVGFVKALNDDYGNKLKNVGDSLLQQSGHFLLNKDKAQAAKDIDGALKELKEDGTINRLTQQYLGYDYKEPPAGV